MFSSNMAASAVRSSLSNLLNSGTSPKDLTEKFREILNQIVALNDENLIEGLKSFIDAGLSAIQNDNYID